MHWCLPVEWELCDILELVETRWEVVTMVEVVVEAELGLGWIAVVMVLLA